MEVKSYPEAKRRILVERSVKDFIVFLEGVTDSKGKQFIRNQLLRRRLSGFRDGRAPFTLTVPMLISDLKEEQELTNCESSIWNLFKNAWICWVGSHSGLNDILSHDFDNTADFDENGECIKLPNSELDVQCFNTLLEANHNNKIDQETIWCFYDYGYFNQDKRIEDLIDQALPLKEIERRRNLAALPDKIDALSEVIDKISQTIADLDSRTSTLESANELEQMFVKLKAEVCQSFELQFHKIDQRIKKTCDSYDAQFLKTKSSLTQMVESSRQIKALKTRLSEFEKSIKALETIPTVTELSINMESQIARLVESQILDKAEHLDLKISDEIKSFGVRLDELESVVTEFESENNNEPKIAAQAIQIGEDCGDHLRNEDARYSDEDDYLSIFQHGLQRFGVTDSQETAAAIHIAMKAFPALEITDARIISVWNMVCGGHLHVTPIYVEMGWLGLQDWFPGLFAEECFKERLERIDLEISIKKMLELGDMPWIIYLRDCDRSFPDSYLPRFLDWICMICRDIKVFLVRSPWGNRCEINEDFYARVARLPQPQNQEPIEIKNLNPRDVVTLTEWKSWCQPNSDINSQHKRNYDFLERLRSEVEIRGWQIPRELLREILHYLQLSHGIMAGSLAFDWGLTLRLLPWIGNRRRLVDVMQRLVDEEDQELPHFRDGLRMAYEQDG